MTKFKPTLAVDASNNLDELKYPKFASNKLDGIRVIFHPELGMVARSLKQIPNKQIREKFLFLKQQAKDTQIIFDGEFYSHKHTFQEITKAIMTKDFKDLKTIKKMEKEDYFVEDYIKDLIDSIKFYIFDANPIADIFVPFQNRLDIIKNLFHSEIEIVEQEVVNSAEDVKYLFQKATTNGYEGLILRSPGAPYKCGRSTLKEEYMLKVKPFETFDGEIVEVIQSTEVDPKAKKTINELGRSVTSKKKGDRILIEKASAFRVKYKDTTVKVVLAMTDEEKKTVWEQRETYIARWIEYKGMLVGSKDKPRHPVMIRFRDDRE